MLFARGSGKLGGWDEHFGASTVQLGQTHFDIIPVQAAVRKAGHREQCEEKRDHALSTLVLVHFVRAEPVLAACRRGIVQLGLEPAPFLVGVFFEAPDQRSFERIQCGACQVVVGFVSAT
jgi:hypothetical protein